MIFKFELPVLMLWCIALVATLLLVKDSGVMTHLAPVYFICMVSNVVVIRWCRQSTLKEKTNSNG